MRKIIQFLAEVKAEFKNITWPKREALLELTIVVIFISLIVSLVLGGFDYLFTQAFALLGNAKNLQKPAVEQVQILPTTAPSPTITLSPIKK